jgi:hypothetical protein
MDKKLKDALNEWTKSVFGEQVKKDLTQTTEDLLEGALPGFSYQPLDEGDGLEKKKPT